MKKLKWLFGLCLMMFVVWGSGVNVWASDDGTDSETDVSDFRWTENDDGTLTITKYVGTDETVVIPSEIEGKNVKNIGYSAFNGNRKIKHITISEGIFSIDGNTMFNNHIIDGAFGDCMSLETVSLPKSLKIIGKCAFCNCSNLKTINLPESLNNIEIGAFYNCTSLEEINLPDNLVNIGEECFSGCDSISKITIPKNVNSLKRYNFYHCDSLREVDIKNGVQRLENRVFMGCNNLEKVIIPNSVTYIDETSFTALYETYYDNSPKQLTIYASPNSYARTYANQMGIIFSCLNTHDWDKGVVTTEATALKDGQKTFTCTACKKTKTKKISKLGLPQKGKSITEIISNNTYKVTKSAAKNGTVELAKISKSTSSITIPDTVTVDGVTYKVTSVSKNIFKNNKKLKKVTIGKNITKINANTFYGCKNLKTITIKSTNLKSVGKNAFKGIHSKASIKVPKSKLAKYKKFLKGKGQKSTVKITK